MKVNVGNLEFRESYSEEFQLQDKTFYHIPGKLACLIGWLTGEVFGKLFECIATGADKKEIEKQNMGQYQWEGSLHKRNFSVMYLEQLLRIQEV